MSRQLRTGAVIPAYNAAKTLTAVLAGVRRIVPDVVVVDDGSEDATAATAAAGGADLLRHLANRGKGAAVRTGLQRLRDRGFERAVAIDADGQHLPEEIPKLLAESDRHPEAMVLAVREKAGQPIALLNRLANGMADWMTSQVAGRAFPDTQCGLRVYPLPATLLLGARGDRMEYDIEILILAARAGMEVRNVRTRVHYPPVAERESHYRAFEDTARIAWVMLSALLRPGGTSP
jgi:glycosyltransferase involved in cell wall biosynthesis